MTTDSTITRIGLISDTHNVVRPEALQHLAGCDAIIHAGDICEQEVLDALERIAPVTAVRGNNDTGDWARALPRRSRWRF
jgi:putative phosphoesterase